MLSRFNLYDFIAVVIPGVFFLWALSTFADVFALKQAVPLSGGITETSVLVVVGYVAGLFLQGLSHIVQEGLLWWWDGFPSARWLLAEDEHLSATYKAEVAGAVQNTFGVVLIIPQVGSDRNARMKRNQEVFYRCYRSLEKLSDIPQNFAAQYGLFRCLLTTFLLLALMSAGRVVWLWAAHSEVRLTMLAFSAACVAAAVVAYWRVTKRGEDFAKSVLDVFLVHFGKKG